jgi:hypothetical protein
MLACGVGKAGKSTNDALPANVKEILGWRREQLKIVHPIFSCQCDL